MTDTDDRYDRAADFATLREAIDWPTGNETRWRFQSALARVEAEIARLTQERDEQATLAETRRISRQQYQERAEAAEAALADAQYQLTEERQWRERAGQLERKLADTRRALEEIEELCDHWKRHDATDPDEHERWRKAAIARAELIGDHVCRALAAGSKP